MKDNKWLRLVTYVTGLVNQELLVNGELINHEAMREVARVRP